MSDEAASVGGLATEKRLVLAFPATEPSWALRAYLVLIGLRQSFGNDHVWRPGEGDKTRRPEFFGGTLDCLTRWCNRHGHRTLRRW